MARKMGLRLTATIDTTSPSEATRAETPRVSALGLSPLPSARCTAPSGEENYWTVMVPFIPIARCGVQWNGYCPGLMLANEIV